MKTHQGFPVSSLKKSVKLILIAVTSYAHCFADSISFGLY